MSVRALGLLFADQQNRETGNRRHRPTAAKPKVRGPRRLGALAIPFVALAIGFGLSADDASAATIDVAAGNVLTVSGGAGVEDFLFTVGNAEPERGFEINTYSTTTGFIELTNAAESFGCSFLREGEATIVCPAGVSRISANLFGGDDDLGVLQLGEAQMSVPFNVQAGAGEDAIDTAAGADVLDGGLGDDFLQGCDEVEGDGADRLLGGDGDDELKGCDGDDVLNGGAGDDDFDFGGFSSDMDGGADTYIGGLGEDHFSYFARGGGGVRISLDGVADDGAPGERDNIAADIENVGGSWGDDVIVGSPNDDYIWGDLGSDVVRGGGGNDTVKGSEGVDEVDGGAGNDEVDGGCHADSIIGGPGVDTLISDGGCGTGQEGSAERSTQDVLDAADGTRDELVFCQIDSIWDPEGDTAIVDEADPVTASGPGRCRTIKVEAGPGPGPRKCVVPQLKKEKLKQAKALLADANCSPGKVKKKKSKKVKKGRVISTKPGVGTILPEGSAVKLTVSKGR